MKKCYRKLTVIIPAYNEENTIMQLLGKVLNVKLPDGISKEIVVVDDCSTDRTSERIKAFMNSRSDVLLKYIKHEKNQGKGSAVRTGIKAATGDVIIIQDADLENNPNEYSLLLPYILSGEYKVVYGSRFLNKNNVYPYRSFYWGGRLVSIITSILFFQKITDEPTCYKMFDAELLKSISLTSDRFGFCPEVTAKTLLQGYKIKEVPISYYPRLKDEGKKIKWYDGIEAIGILLRYRFFPIFRKAEKDKSNASVGMFRKISLNVISVLFAWLLVFFCYKKNSSYAWVYDSLLVGNYKIASANKHLTIDEVREFKIGFNFSYLMFLKAHTPENAVIWMPERKAYFPEGKKSPFSGDIASKMYRLRVLYPRKIVDAGENNNKYSKKITHVAVLDGQGADKLNYKLKEVLDFAVYPVNKPNK